MADGYLISPQDGLELTRLLQAWRSGQLGPRTLTPSSLEPVPVRCVMLSGPLIAHGAAPAIVLRQQREQLVYDLRLLRTPLTQRWRLRMDGQLSPEFSAQARPEELTALLRDWSPLAGLEPLAMLGGTLQRWRLQLRRDPGAPLDLSSPTAELEITQTTWIPSGETLRLQSAGDLPTTLPAGTQLLAHRSGTGWIAGELWREPLPVPDPPLTELRQNCCQIWMTDGELAACGLLLEQGHEYYEVIGIASAGLANILGHDSGCQWMSDSHERSCDSDSIPYVLRLRPRAGISSAAETVTERDSDYLEVVLEPEDGEVPTPPTRCRQRGIWSNLRRFLPWAGAPFALDPAASRLHPDQPLTKACEICVVPAVDPAFLDVSRESPYRQECLRQAECDLADLFHPPRIPRRVQLDLREQPRLAPRPLDPEWAQLWQLSYGQCGYRWRLPYGPPYDCRGGYGPAADHSHTFQIFLDPCRGELRLRQENSQINCAESSLSRSWSQEALYRLSDPAPWDFREPLTCVLISAELYDTPTTYGVQPPQTIDTTSQWAATWPTLTLTPLLL